MKYEIKIVKSLIFLKHGTQETVLSDLIGKRAMERILAKFQDGMRETKRCNQLRKELRYYTEPGTHQNIQRNEENDTQIIFLLLGSLPAVES